MTRTKGAKGRDVPSSRPSRQLARKVAIEAKAHIAIDDPA